MKSVQSLSLASVSFGSDTQQRQSSLREKNVPITSSSTGSVLEKREEICELELALTLLSNTNRTVQSQNWDQHRGKGWSWDKEPARRCLGFLPLLPLGKMKGVMEINHAWKSLHPGSWTRVRHPEAPSGRAASLDAAQAQQGQSHFIVPGSLGIWTIACFAEVLYHITSFWTKSSNFGTGLGIPDSQHALAFSQSNQRKQDFKEISSPWWAWRTFIQSCHWPEWH